MKVYMIGRTVHARSTDVAEFWMFRTITILGKAYYSTAFILDALYERRGYPIFLWFTSMEHVKNSMAARGWEDKDNEPTSGVTFKNPNNYDGPDYTHIIYELEIPDEMAQNLPSFASQDYDRHRHPERKNEYELSESQHNAFLQESTLVSANIAGTIYQLNTRFVDYKPLLFQDFMQEYRKKYSSEWFTNPWSKMNMLLNSGEINDMPDVYEHAFKFPNSRTATVLKSMLKDPTLLSNIIIEDKLSNELNTISLK